MKQAEQKVNLPSPNVKAKEGEGEKLAPSPTSSSAFSGGLASDSFGFGADNGQQAALLRSVFADHRSTFSALNQRRKALEAIANVWKQGDIIGALKTVQLSPIDVQVDFLTFSSYQFCSNSKRNELLSIGVAAAIAPLCAHILAGDSQKQGIANLCIRYCHAILHAFDQRLVLAVKNGVLNGTNDTKPEQGESVQRCAALDPGVTIVGIQPHKVNTQRDIDCAKILRAFQRISTILEKVDDLMSEPGGKGSQLSAIAGSGAGSSNSGGQVAEVLARMQGVFRASA